VFRYNDDPTAEEIDLDMDGEESTPERGAFIERKGTMEGLRMNRDQRSRTL
jgi:hypothetical protein